MNDELIRLPVFLTRYPDLMTEGSLRWAIFHRADNGIEKAGAVVKAPTGRWLVNVPKMRAWLAGGAK